ncbi:BTAD domain-containing putative transcriptional regulator [Streptomyces sp. NPDC127097]|uniref:AfsR/SARP family transcriptional regulator n=1 Tax=Streptomyces sp. NPDC127097 TaxID=3347136 RepID=UPI003667322C
MKFGILGPVVMASDDSPLAIGAPRQQVVLATLLLGANHLAATDYLVECAWWQEPPPSATVNIRGHIAGLRRLLRDAGEPEDRLTTHSGGYTLRVEAGELDLSTFMEELRLGDQALAEGAIAEAAERFTAALQVWRGRPLEGLSLGVPLRAELERLGELRLLAIERYAQTQLDLGQPDTLVPELQALTTQHPFRERLWELLIKALHRSGRQAEALATYARVRRILAEELGVDPMEQLRRLEEMILRGDSDLGAPARAMETVPACQARLPGIRVKRVAFPGGLG